jgi:hypothetical protein
MYLSGRLMTLLDLSSADFRRFLIVLVDTSIGQPLLLEYGTGCEWHPPRNIQPTVPYGGGSVMYLS